MDISQAILSSGLLLVGLITMLVGSVITVRRVRFVAVARKVRATVVEIRQEYDPPTESHSGGVIQVVNVQFKDANGVTRRSTIRLWQSQPPAKGLNVLYDPYSDPTLATKVFRDSLYDLWMVPVACLVVGTAFTFLGVAGWYGVVTKG